MDIDPETATEEEKEEALLELKRRQTKYGDQRTNDNDE